jgi:hypothetical protein
MRDLVGRPQPSPKARLVLSARPDGQSKDWGEGWDMERKMLSLQRKLEPIRSIHFSGDTGIA